jgi:hypothetical protein
MPYSSGTYSLPSGNPVVTGTTISSSTTNTTNSDIATALSTCVLKDGTQTITANLPMASHKLTGLSAGTAAGDSVEYGGSPSFTNLAYTGTLTGSTGILNIGSGQLYKDASGNVGVGTSSPAQKLDVVGNISATGSLNSINTFGFKNRIINGGMVIDQRNAGAVYTPTDGTYSLDRYAWRVSQASKLTTQQSSAAPTGFVNSMLVTSSSAYSITAGDFFTVLHRIEGFNTADLGWGTATAQTITLSFWVRSSLTGTFGGAFANGSFTRSYPFTYSIPTANTWTQISVSIAGDTSGTWATTNTLGVQVSFGLGVGSSFSGTAGSWQSISAWSATGAVSVVGTSGATFYITGVQLEKGSVATSFDQRAYSQELAMCQRYYWPLRGTTATPSFLARTNAGAVGQGPGLNLKFPQPMRTAPTATQVGSWSHTNTSGGAGPTTPSCFTTDYVTFYVDSAAAGDCFYYLNGTSNGFNFSAEL